MVEPFPVRDTETGVAYGVEDVPDLCSPSVLSAALAAAVVWLLSSVHSEVHFKDREHDALVQVKHRRQSGLGLFAMQYMSSDSLKRPSLLILQALSLPAMHAPLLSTLSLHSYNTGMRTPAYTN